MSRALLKEAIADAKAVKEAAIANAKAALEEAFTPHLKELLASKLESLEEEEMETEGMGKASKMKRAMDEYGMEHPDIDMDGDGDVDADDVALMKEIDLDEILAELDGLDEKKIKTARQTDNRDAEEEDNPFDKGRTKHQPMDEAKKSDDSEEEADDEEFNMDNIEKAIRKVIDDMVEAGELEAGEGESREDEDSMKDLEDDAMGEEDEEIDLQELIREMKKEEQMREYVEGGPSSENALLKAVDAALEKGGELAKKLLKLLASGGGGWQRGGMYEEDLNEYVEGGPSSENALLKAVDAALEKGGELAKKLMALLAQGGGGWDQGGIYEDELNEAYSTIKTLRSELNEVNLLNAKLLYTNKIFKAKNLTEGQKVKVLSTFDKATTVKEVKLVFESLSTSIAASNSTVKAPIKESMGFASKASGVVKNNQTIETDAVIARMKKLAGL